MSRDMYEQYDEYLNTHIANVKMGFSWIVLNMPHLVEEFDVEAVAELSTIHDISKWLEEEYDPYVEYFYGEQRTEEVKSNFDYAWLNHQNHNQHHWQYWVLIEEAGSIKPLKMPHICVVEMLMDWWAFSWKNENLYEIFDWYDSNKQKMILHEETRAEVEDILQQLRSKLDEVHSNGHKE